MPRFARGLSAAVLLAAVCAGPVSAATPLDPAVPPKLTGWVPPSQGVLKCERYMNKRTALYPLRCVMNCSISTAAAIAKGHPHNLDECENTAFKSCRMQYDRAMGKLDTRECPACLDEEAEQQALYATFRNATKSFNQLIYCETSECTPFADGSGCVSNTRDAAMCQNRMAANVAKLFKCLELKCHQKTTEALFWGKQTPPGNVFECEETDPSRSCKARFLRDTASLVGCPTCLLDGVTHRAEDVFNAVQGALDSQNGEIYCGQ